MADNFIDNYEHRVPNIFYTFCNIPGRGCNTDDFKTQLLTCCSCSECRDDSNNCACINRHGMNYTVLDDGLKVLTDVKLCRSYGVMECNDSCLCDPSRCTNRLIQFGPNPNLQIAPCEGKGLGMFAKSHIVKGAFVCEYAGEIVSSHEANQRRKSDITNYILTLKESSNGNITETNIDATSIANIGRYINHSCDPNCCVIPVRVNSPVPSAAIFALRDIKPNEEITYSYSGTDGGVEGGTVPSESVTVIGRKRCLCNRKDKCSGYLPFNF